MLGFWDLELQLETPRRGCAAELRRAWLTEKDVWIVWIVSQGVQARQKRRAQMQNSEQERQDTGS